MLFKTVLTTASRYKLMSMKSKSTMMAAIAAMMAAGINNREYNYLGYDEESETKEEKERRLKSAELERNKLNGLKEFIYAEGSIWSLNQKNADRKANKLGYTKQPQNGR